MSLKLDWRMSDDGGPKGRLVPPAPLDPRVLRDRLDALRPAFERWADHVCSDDEVESPPGTPTRRESNVSNVSDTGNKELPERWPVQLR